MNKYKQYIIMRERLLSDTQSLRSKLQKAIPDPSLRGAPISCISARMLCLTLLTTGTQAQMVLMWSVWLGKALNVADTVAGQGEGSRRAAHRRSA